MTEDEYFKQFCRERAKKRAKAVLNKIGTVLDKIGFVSLCSLGAALALGPLTAGITGSVLRNIEDDKLNAFEGHKIYSDNNAICDYVEGNSDKVVLTDKDNSEEIVLSQNEWNRLKNLFQNTVVTARNQYENGEINIAQYEWIEEQYLIEFRRAVTVEQFVTINDGSGVLKNFDEVYNRVENYKVVEMVGWIFFGLEMVAPIVAMFCTAPMGPI